MGKPWAIRRNQLIIQEFVPRNRPELPIAHRPGRTLREENPPPLPGPAWFSFSDDGTFRRAKGQLGNSSNQVQRRQGERKIAHRLPIPPRGNRGSSFPTI